MEAGEKVGFGRRALLVPSYFLIFFLPSYYHHSGTKKIYLFQVSFSHDPLL